MWNLCLPCARAVSKFAQLEEEDDFSELFTVPEIVGMSEHNTLSVMPDFSKSKVVDIFKKLVSFPLRIGKKCCCFLYRYKVTVGIF